VQIVRDLSELPQALEALRARAPRIALVPTMGALHAGHLALVEDAKARADGVVASIFINPLQFNDPGDLERYPRTESADVALLEAAGCDLVWMPTADDLYPAGFATTVHVDGAGVRWEGEHRPGHFDGVATVVAKLFAAIRPDAAIFGEKDFQQLAVIRRMEKDLGLGVEVVGHPTVRSADGLAMSSRNALLSDAERALAPELHRLLQRAASQLRVGVAADEALSSVRDGLAAAGFGKIDYVALADPASLEPLEALPKSGDARLLAAAFLGTVRLIDNIRVVSDTVSE
jgi:pantoate--beta-alanine ligase